jgi:hypothetical protein
MKMAEATYVELETIYKSFHHGRRSPNQIPFAELVKAIGFFIEAPRAEDLYRQIIPGCCQIENVKDYSEKISRLSRSYHLTTYEKEAREKAYRRTQEFKHEMELREDPSLRGLQGVW